MKWNKLAFLPILVLVACSENQTTKSANESQNRGSSSQTKLNDSPEVANARAQILEIIKTEKQKAVSNVPDADSDTKTIVSETFDRVLKSVASRPASSGEELRDFAIAEHLKVSKEVILASREKLASEIPKRLRAEPVPGEKRESTNLDGTCSNDLTVDTKRFALQMMDMMVSASDTSTDAGSRMEVVKKNAQNLLDSCDEIVDRYGVAASCVQEDKAVFSMRDFRDRCNAAREQFRSVL